MKRTVFIALMALLGVTQLNASSSKSSDFNPTDFIMHHISDAHEFHIMDIDGKPVSLPLPIILWTEKGLVTFMSHEFHHNDDGTLVVEEDGMKFVKHHENIYQLNEGQSVVTFDEEHHPTNAIKPLDFSVTKNVFSLFLSAAILFLLFGSAFKKYKSIDAPKGKFKFLEPLVVFVRDDIARPNIGDKYHKYMPYLLTVFFFIWINNLIGLVPFFPFSANLTGSIAFTFTLATITFLITTLSGNKNYWGHIFATPGVPVWLAPIMIPVELMGMFTKPVALMIRLFANITAGHIIILSLVSLIFIFQTVAVSPVSLVFVLFMNVLELLVAALQAYVFTLLSALFIGQAVEDHH